MQIKCVVVDVCVLCEYMHTLCVHVLHKHFLEFEGGRVESQM